MTDAAAPDADAATKAALRADLRRRRHAFVEEIGARGELLVDTLFAADAARPLFAQARIVAFYVAQGAEVDPLPLLFQAVDMGLATVLPRVVDRAAPLAFHHWLPGDPLMRGLLGTMEPAATAEALVPDLIVTPLLGFDAAGGRIGQGAGCYDRTFAALPDARRLGLAWSVQRVDAIPAEPWDMPLHAIATERGLVRA